MAITGTYQDHYKDMFRDILLHEAQQMGSVLEQTVMSEMMEGNKTYFDKMGKVSNYVKVSRNQLKTPTDIVFERRQIQEQWAEFDHIIDKEDLIKYVTNPKNDVVMAAVSRLGRSKDEIILSALSGNAVVTQNGTAANQALTLSVLVNDHSFDTQLGAETGSADTGLTPAKLKKGIVLLGENYGSSGQRTICAAPIRQIMNLNSFISTNSSDYRSKKPLEGPGVVENLSGYLGIDFIAYEGTGINGDSDEMAYLYTADAIKLGIYEGLTVEIFPDYTRAGNPDMISVWEAIGATRMYEEKVVKIACDPLA